VNTTNDKFIVMTVSSMDCAPVDDIVSIQGLLPSEHVTKRVQKALLAESQKTNAVVKLIPVVGDFVEGRTTVCVIRQRFWNRRKYTGFFCQLWDRTDAGAGSDLCVPNYPRYRVESALAGNQ
jgi:hypothetical protein